VKGTGASAIEHIIEARAAGPFTDLFDFCRASTGASSTAAYRIAGARRCIRFDQRSSGQPDGIGWHRHGSGGAGKSFGVAGQPVR